MHSALNGESIIKVTVQWLRDRVPGQDVGEGESSGMHPRLQRESGERPDAVQGIPTG